MDPENAASGGDVDVAPVISPPNLESEDTFSPEQAFEAYQKRTNPTAEGADEATAVNQSEAQADDAGHEDVPGETEGDDQAEQPSIDAPRSWTKEDKELFSSLPRETQERLAERERSREGDFLRRQNEATEAGKALAAELEQAKQARTQYEAKQAAYTKTLTDALQAEFGDIQTMADVRKLQAEDPFRFQAWQIRQMELGQAQAEKQQLEQLNKTERTSKRNTYEVEQNKLLSEMVPEMADPKKAAEMRDRAVQMLNDDLKLSTDQLQKWMADDIGHEILSNAGIQRMIADRLKFNEIKAAPPKAIPKPVPAVVKPGVVPPKGTQGADSVQALRSKLSGSGSVEDAFALYQAKNKRRA